MSQRVLRICLALAFFCFALSICSAGQSQTEQGIRIDLPADGNVAVQNQYGSVKAEVWDEKFVLITATIDSGSPLKRSPVVIEPKSNQLLISIVRTPIDPPAAINVSIKIPASTHAEVNTTTGQIELIGLPASAMLTSVSGDIRAELSRPLNAEIEARVESGSIRSDLDSPSTQVGRLLKTRVGNGERVLRINSRTGQISLLAPSQVVEEFVAPSKRPTLLANETHSPASGTPATATSSEEVSEGDIIRVDSQLVTLNMSVVDRNTSKGVLDLTQNDFHLFEDGTEQRILQFDSASAPFDLILLIDLSGSTRDVVKLIRQAALHFVEAARPSDRIGIITFAGKPTVVSPVTLDREQLRRSIDTIDTSAGDTKLYDATEFTLRQATPETRNTRRTAVVLMSDGLDGTVPGVSGQQGSKLSYRELLSNVQEFDGVLYTLWLNTYYEALNPKDTQPEAFDTGHDRMKELAETGGGAFYEVERLQDLAGAYERVVADLGTVYSLSYRPQNNARDGKWRSIRITLNRPTAVARGKRGYYAN